MNDLLQVSKMTRLQSGLGRPTAKGRHLLAGMVAISVGMFGVHLVEAQSTTWTFNGTGNFTTGSNWSDGAPSGGSSWAINNGGTAQVSFNPMPVTAGNGALGNSFGESGTLTILSGGDMVLAPSDLAVGRGGSGLLTVESGGGISIGNLFIAENFDSSGTLNVTGGGLASGNNLDVTEFLHIGHGGTGSLTLSGNGLVQSKKADIGRNLDSVGSASVQEGIWKNTEAIFVGVEGNGTLTVDPLGTVTSESLYIGQNSSGRGIVNVAGGNITLTNTLVAGVNGEGNLTVSGAGSIATQFLQVGLENGSVGSATLTDTASVTAAQFVQIGSNGTATGTLNLNGNAELTSSETINVGVGAGSNGTLNAAGNSTVTATDLFSVGDIGGSTGVVNLTDNATLNTASLVVGTSGSGTVDVGAGAKLNAGTIELAELSGSSGTLNASGGTISTASIQGSGPGASLNLLDGSTLRPINANGIIITGFSPGNFNLTGNVTFETNALLTSQIQSQMSGTGQFIKTGSGAVSFTAANTYSGGTVIQSGTVGVAVDDALGTGNVAIGNAQILGSSNSTIGSEIPLIQVDASQTATFSATAGNTFTVAPVSVLLGNGSTFRAGSSGNNGTVVFAPDLAASLAPGTGGVTVDSGTLQAGNSQLGLLTAEVGQTTVSTGATLDFQDYLASGGIDNLQGDGTVNIGSNASTTLTVNSGNFSGSITGAGGLVKASSGTLILSGGSDFTGGTTVNAGTLIVNGSLETGLGPVEVNTGGTLGGTGEVGPITLNGGTISPGNSAGTLIAGDLLWSAGVIVFELGPDQTTSDLIQTGTLQGLGPPGTSYEFTFVDQGMTPNFTYNLITFSGPPLIDINDFGFTNGGGFGGNFGYSGSTLQFTVIPEPSTWALLALAFVVLAVRSTKRARSRKTC